MTELDFSASDSQDLAKLRNALRQGLGLDDTLAMYLSPGIDHLVVTYRGDTLKIPMRDLEAAGPGLSCARYVAMTIGAWLKAGPTEKMSNQMFAKVFQQRSKGSGTESDS